MANSLYTKAKEKMLSAGIDVLTLNVKAVLVDITDYVADITTDEFLDDIPAGARVATSPNLANKSITGGVFNADNATFSGVSGDESEAIVIYIDTGIEGTSPLVAYLDTATGLPVTPNSGDIIIQWDDGANKIFKL
jgi:hypothetical protein